MEELLAQYSFLQVEYIDAIDGRMMSKAEISDRFDLYSCMRHNGRELNRGESGVH